MPRTLDEIRDLASTLSAEERRELAEDNLSVAADPAVAEAWLTEARRRLADLRSGRDPGLTHEEFLADE